MLCMKAFLHYIKELERIRLFIGIALFLEILPLGRKPLNFWYTIIPPQIIIIEISARALSSLIKIKLVKNLHMRKKEAVNETDFAGIKPNFYARATFSCVFYRTYFIDRYDGNYCTYLVTFIFAAKFPKHI